FVLFNLEENGLIGSRQYVQTMRPKWREQGIKIVGMLSLEMLGYYDTKLGSQTNPFKGVPGLPQGELAGDFIALTTTASHAPFCTALAEAMTAAEPKVKILKVDMFPIAPPDLLRSDHAPFMAAGVPAIMVTDTANFRNPNYHKPTDTLETLNPEYFTRTVRALAGAIDALAGPMDKPAIEWKRQAHKPADEPDPAKPKSAPDEQPKPPTEPAKPG
ncbi:MAG: M28 family metallopeptidase, partial [Phycisphaerales bacterium]